MRGIGADITPIGSEEHEVAFPLMIFNDMI